MEPASSLLLLEYTFNLYSDIHNVRLLADFSLAIDVVSDKRDDNHLSPFAQYHYKFTKAIKSTFRKPSRSSFHKWTKAVMDMYKQTVCFYQFSFSLIIQTLKADEQVCEVMPVTSCGGRCSFLD